MKLPSFFRAPKKYVAPCGSCRFPYVTDRKAEVRAMGAYGKNLLAQIDERRQQVAASFHAPKKCVAPCGSCRFRLHALSDFLDFRKTENYGKNLLAQIRTTATSCRVVPLRGIPKKNDIPWMSFFFGSPMRNRTADSAVRGQRLNRLTMRPFFVVI